ncbi:ATP-binding protein [Kitasatospora sp. NPDC059408]|uniref:ATP-binding protein n=1 Tax=Kitasatospora sp. NPDC059408 TaxID=3346823 RepID=UPI0036797752
MSPDLLPAPVEFHITSQDSNPVFQARETVERIIQDWGVPLSRAGISDLKLCTSEVVANALKHAGSECWIKVIWTGEHLKIEVQDRSLRLPHMPKAGEDDESGRGLLLVESFAQSWGWEPKGLGKTVFFLIRPDVLPDDQLLARLVRVAAADPALTADPVASEPQVLSARGLVLA